MFLTKLTTVNLQILFKQNMSTKVYPKTLKEFGYAFNAGMYIFV